MITYQTITVFNSQYHASDRTKVYVPTVIENVSLLQSAGINTNDGVWSDQARYKIRIPYIGSVVQDFREYVPEEQYESDRWTLRNGDYILLGTYTGVKEQLTKSEMDAWARENKMRLITITEYADNTVRGSNAVKHWRVGGA